MTSPRRDAASLAAPLDDVCVHLPTYGTDRRINIWFLFPMAFLELVPDYHLDLKQIGPHVLHLYELVAYPPASIKPHYHHEQRPEQGFDRRGQDWHGHLGQYRLGCIQHSRGRRWYVLLPIANPSPRLNSGNCVGGAPSSSEPPVISDTLMDPSRSHSCSSPSKPLRYHGADHGCLLRGPYPWSRRDRERSHWRSRSASGRWCRQSGHRC